MLNAEEEDPDHDTNLEPLKTDEECHEATESTEEDLQAHGPDEVAGEDPVTDAGELSSIP